MKTIISLVGCFFIAAFTFTQAQTEQQLKQTVEEFRKVLIEPTEEELLELTAKDLDYWHSSGNYEDQETFIATLLSGKSDFVTLSFSDQKIKLHDQTAIVHHVLEAKTNDSGKPGEVKIGNLLVWQWQKNRWKLIARQAYKLK